MTVFIYALIDPMTGGVHYVGKTLDMKEREYQHFTSGLKVTDKRSAWIASLRAQHTRPKMHLLEECTLDGWQEAEKRWIAHYRSSGAPITNVKAGGGHSNPKKWPSKLARTPINAETFNAMNSLEDEGHHWADIVREALIEWLDLPTRAIVPFERKYAARLAGLGIDTETRQKINALRAAGAYEADIVRSALVLYLRNHPTHIPERV